MGINALKCTHLLVRLLTTLEAINMNTIARTIILLLATLFIFNLPAICQEDTSRPKIISITPLDSPEKKAPLPQTPNSRTLIIVYNDGEQIELTKWLWFYARIEWVTLPEEPKKKRGILKEIFNPPSIEERAREDMEDRVGKRPIQHLQVINEPSKNLKLSMEGLSKPGVSLNDIELSETQFSSIKFVWKDRNLNKVIVSLSNGKMIEFPVLKPPGNRELYLEGNTTVNGFSGRFVKLLSTRVSENSEADTIVEIKIK